MSRAPGRVDRDFSCSSGVNSDREKKGYAMKDEVGKSVL